MEITREHLAGLELAISSLRKSSGTLIGRLSAISDLEELMAQASAAPEQEPVGVITYGGMQGVNTVVSIERKLHELPIGTQLYTHADPSEVDQLRAENKRLMHRINSFLETMGRTCELLGVDPELAKNADGKPSDVLHQHAYELRQRADAAEQKLAEAQALLGSAYMVMDQANRNAGECQSCNERPEDDGLITHHPDCIFVATEIALSASAESAKNQCDGCQAGIPQVNGTHRMGNDGGYPDAMSCQASRYAEPAKGGDGEENS